MKEELARLIKILKDPNVTREGKERLYDNFLRTYPFYDSSKLDKFF